MLKLVIILKPFDEVTEILGGSKYSTLSIMVPAVKELENRLNAYEPKNTTIDQVKSTILNNLRQRWDLSLNLGLYGSFFDLRFKKLSFIYNSVSF